MATVEGGDPQVDPSRVAEILTAVYFDTVSRWLADTRTPFDLSTALAARVDLVLAGLITERPSKRLGSPMASRSR